MAKKVLIGTVVIGATRYYAGALLDESAEAEAVAAVVAAGGQLLDEGDPIVDAAALTAQQKLRDGQWREVDGVMIAAVAKSAHAAAQGGGGGIVEEHIRALRYGYKAPITGSIFVGPVAAGAPLNETVFTATENLNVDSAERFRMQIIVGDVPDDVLDGNETGALPATVQITLLGAAFGEPISSTLTISAKGAYDFVGAWDGDGFVSLTSDIDVGASVVLATAKGGGTRQPFAADTLRLSLDGGLTYRAVASAHLVTGAFVPGGLDYNAGEITDAVAWYRPA